MVPSAADHRVEPVGDKGPLFEPANSQGLPPPDLLRRSPRSGAHVMAAGADADSLDYLLRLGDNCADPRPPAVGMVRPRAGAGGGHRARQRRARPDRPGAALARPRRRGRGQGPRRRRRSPICATPATSATCCWSSSPNGDFADTMMRQFLFDAWHDLLLDGAARLGRPRASPRSPPRRSRRSPTISSAPPTG